MPHLQFDINKKIDTQTKKEFSQKIREAFSEVMDTKTSYIAISIREFDRYNLSIGRANEDDYICLLNLDIRKKRTLEQRRELALRFMDIVSDYFKIENRNIYLCFTQHDGEDFHLIEKYLDDWIHNEDPLA